MKTKKKSVKAKKKSIANATKAVGKFLARVKKATGRSTKKVAGKAAAKSRKVVARTTNDSRRAVDKSARGTNKYANRTAGVVSRPRGGLRSKFEDAVFTEKTHKVEIVQEESAEMHALNSKRQEIIDPLEGLRSLVRRQDNGLTDSRTKEIECNIDKVKRSICYDRYRVTVFGAFSAGKSTLLNALMGADYLPSADLPTTNVTTEIFRSEQFYFFIPNCDITKAQSKALQDEVSKEIPGGTFLENLERDGQSISGIGVVFQPNDSKGFRQVIEQLADQQSCHETGLSRFKKRIKDGSSTVLQLGIPSLPEWLGEITLTDAPGAGSVYKGHEAIIDDIIPKTQLVLYVVEAAKAGSLVDEWLLCDRIVNSYHRKIFFVLNKIDQQNNDEIEDSLAELKEHIPSIKAGSDGLPPPPRPVFLKASALCETMANRLSDGSATLNDLVDNKKLSISRFLVSDEWTNAESEEGRKRAAIRMLREQSRFDELRDKIKTYLHTENKEFPFAEMASDLIKICGQEMEGVCRATIAALQADRSEEELQEHQKELRRQREKSAKEVRDILKDLRESVLRPETGALSKVKSKLEEIPSTVVEKLKRKLADNGELSRFTANKCEVLNTWLNKEVSEQTEPISRSLDSELRRQGKHLIEQLKPILKAIDDATIEQQCDLEPSTTAPIVESGDKSPLGNAVIAGVSGGALAAVLGLTVGSTAVAGTGLAGIAGSLGLGSLASTLAGFGLGTQATTLIFGGIGLGPIVAIVGLIAATIFFFWGKSHVRETIVNKVRSELEKQIIGDGPDSIINQFKARVEAFANKTLDGVSSNLNKYLDNLDKQEKMIIAEVVKTKDDKDKKVKSLEAFRMDVESFVESSIQSLRELNPGKDPAYG